MNDRERMLLTEAQRRLAALMGGVVEVQRLARHVNHELPWFWQAIGAASAPLAQADDALREVFRIDSEEEKRK